jgi:hypothetical protein
MVGSFAIERGSRRCAYQVAPRGRVGTLKTMHIMDRATLVGREAEEAL